MITSPTDTDPRVIPATDELILTTEEDGPVVGREAQGLPLAVIMGAFAVLAVALFLWLNARRSEAAEVTLVTPVEQAVAAPAALPPPIDLPLIQVANTEPPPAPPPAAQAYVPPQPAVAQTTTTTTTISSPRGDPAARLRAPALVVDLGGGGSMHLAQADTLPPGSAAAAAAAGVGAGMARGPGPTLSDSEQFAARVGGEEPERARATAMRNPSYMVPQGAVIPGVLETAINSDLPGYTRAVVSRDVLSFDGRQVLIPRGSRLIGQYKSAVALGQTRAFIIWTRAIRPDGVSIMIGSPGTDALGRGGLDGEVDRHFFRRFSGSILLSVLNAGVASLGSQPSTQISIGSPGAAAGLAGSALQGENIPPTIKVKQGEAIRIFVARDLDFSGVGAAL